MVLDDKRMYNPGWLVRTYFCRGHSSSIRVLRAQALDSVDEILEAHLVLDIDNKSKAREQGKEKARRNREGRERGTRDRESHMATYIVQVAVSKTLLPILSAIGKTVEYLWNERKG